METNYKKNMLFLFLVGFCVGSTTFSMNKITGTFTDKVKDFGKQTQTQVENLKSQVVAQARKALESNDKKLLELAQNALNKALQSPLVPQGFKEKLLEPLAQRIKNKLNERKASTAQTTLPVGKKAYIPVSQIRPGQSRYAQPNVNQKVEKMQKNKGKFAEGKSSLNIDEKAIPVVKGPFKDKPYVLIDGHHDVLAAIKLGSTEIPIVVKEDMTHLAPEEFYTQAAHKGLIYYQDIEGNLPTTYPTNFEQLADDPYRWFATVITRKCANRQATESTSEAQKDSYAYNYPVLVKSDVKGQDTPFIEFIVANVLSEAFQDPKLAEFNSEVQQKSNSPSKELVEKARDILRSHFANRPDLPQIRLIATGRKYTDIKNLCSAPDFNPKF